MALILLAGLAYWPALHGGFVWDDDKYVTENPLLTAPDGLWRIWFTAHLQSQYFPLVFTTFKLERLLWGLNFLGYHAVNICLQCANAVLFWLVLRRLKLPAAWLAAAIFALHPVNVESVAWITELKNVESAFFCLLAMMAWLKFIEARGPQKRDAMETSEAGNQKSGIWLWYALALGAYALALFAKTTACVLPAALALVLWLRRERFAWARVLQLLPFVVWGVIMGLVSVWWENQLGANEGIEAPLSFMQRLLLATRAPWFYAGKLLFPVHLCFSYPQWELNPSDGSQYLPLFAVVAFGAMAWFWRNKISRGAFAGLLFFLAALSPLLGFINEYTFRYSFVADHYQYLAAMGLIALGAAGLRRALATLGANLAARTAVQVLLLAALGSLTWRQCGVYKDSETLWQATLKENPNSWMAHLNLGVDLFKAGRLDDALNEYQQAVLLHPNGDTEQGNYGMALLEKGRYVEAIEHFNAALALNPNMFSVHNGLGLAYFKTGHPEQAEPHYRRALELQPTASGVWLNLAQVLARRGQVEEALQCCRKAASLAPRDADPLCRLEELLAQNQEFEESAAVCREALKLSPNRADIMIDLGNALAQQRNYLEAVAVYEKALALNPDNASYHYNLGCVLGAAGKVTEARRELREALRLKANFPQAQRQLFLLAAQGTQ